MPDPITTPPATPAAPARSERGQMLLDNLISGSGETPASEPAGATPAAGDSVAPSTSPAADGTANPSSAPPAAGVTSPAAATPEPGITPPGSAPTGAVPGSHSPGADSGGGAGTGQPGTGQPDDPAAQPFSFLDALGELGFRNIESEQEAQQRLIEAYQHQREETQRRQAETQQYQIYLQNLQFAQQHGQPAPLPPGQPGHPQPQPSQVGQSEENWWNPPAVDPRQVERFREVVVDPESGQRSTRWKADTPVEIKAAHEAYQAYVDKWTDDIVYRPHEVLPRIVQQEAQKVFERLYQERTAEQTEEQFIQSVQQQYGDVLYQRDPVTREFMVDPRTRDYIPSAQGRQILGLMSRAADMGIQSVQDRWQYATELYQAQAGQLNGNGRAPAVPGAPPAVATLAAPRAPITPAPLAPQPTAAQVAAANRQAFLQRAAGGGANAIPDRAGSVANPNQPQNRKLSPGEQFLANLQGAGADVAVPALI